MLSCRECETGDVYACTAYLLKNETAELFFDSSSNHDFVAADSSTATAVPQRLSSFQLKPVSNFLSPVPNEIRQDDIAGEDSCRKTKRSLRYPTSVIEANLSELYPELYPELPGSKPVRRTQSCPKQPYSSARRYLKPQPVGYPQSQSHGHNFSKRSYDTSGNFNMTPSNATSNLQSDNIADLETVLQSLDMSPTEVALPPAPYNTVEDNLGGPSAASQQEEILGQLFLHHVAKSPLSKNSGASSESSGKFIESPFKNESDKPNRNVRQILRSPGMGSSHNSDSRKVEMKCRSSDSREVPGTCRSGTTVTSVSAVLNASGDVSPGAVVVRTPSASKDERRSHTSSIVIEPLKVDDAVNRKPGLFPTEAELLVTLAPEKKDSKDSFRPVSCYDNLASCSSELNTPFQLDNNQNVQKSTKYTLSGTAHQPELEMPSGVQLPRQDSDVDRWQCKQCTYLNPAELMQCEMCGTMCVTVQSMMMPSFVGLQCPYCTFMNEIDATDCKMCNAVLKGMSTYI